MKASIIIPTFDRHELLLKAMATAAAQDYPKEQYEVVVVNDGGRQTTEEKVRAGWKGPVQLKYADIPHRGLSAAVNKGIELSAGEYFTVVPDDDGVLPNKLKLMCGFLDDHPEANVTYSLPKYINARGQSVATPTRLRRFLLAHPILTWGHILRGDGLWVHGTGTVYRRSVIESVGVWDEDLPTSEEFEWHLRLLHGGNDFHAVDAVTTLYRKHGGSKSNYYSQRRAKYRKQIYGKFFPDGEYPVLRPSAPPGRPSPRLKNGRRASVRPVRSGVRRVERKK